MMLYALFGLTSVAYEVLWARVLSVQFGVSIFAVVLTVATFMGGLGAGSLFSARRVRLVKRPLLLLAALEGGIAVYALILPTVLQIASAGMEGRGGSAFVISVVRSHRWYCPVPASAPSLCHGGGIPINFSVAGE